MTTRNMESQVADMQHFLQNRFFGKYRGIVKEVDGQTGKIKAQVPAIFGTETSPWAMPCVPFAGPQHGLVLLPEEDDGIWIEFEGGDPDSPIWSGGWWADGEWPSPATEKIRSLITKEGLQLLMDDDAKEITVKHPDGAELKMTGSEIDIKIGQAEIKMSDSEISIKLSPAGIKLSASGISFNDGAMEVKP